MYNLQVHFFRYTQLNDQAVLFPAIQFSKVRWFKVLLCITNI